MAQRMNADHLMVMQNLDVIQGKPSFSAKFLIGMVNSCGRFAPIRYKMTDLGEIKNVQYQEKVWANGQSKMDTRTSPHPIKNIQCIARYHLPHSMQYIACWACIFIALHQFVFIFLNQSEFVSLIQQCDIYPP